jgi:hypothetical protein
VAFSRRTCAITLDRNKAYKNAVTWVRIPPPPFFFLQSCSFLLLMPPAHSRSKSAGASPEHPAAAGPEDTSPHLTFSISTREFSFLTPSTCSGRVMRHAGMTIW